MNRFSQLLIHELEVLDNAIDVCNTECDESAERKALHEEIAAAAKEAFLPEKFVIYAKNNEQLASIKEALNHYDAVALFVDFVKNRIYIKANTHAAMKGIKFEFNFYKKWQEQGVKLESVDN